MTTYRIGDRVVEVTPQNNRVHIKYDGNSLLGRNYPLSEVATPEGMNSFLHYATSPYEHLWDKPTPPPEGEQVASIKQLPVSLVDILKQLEALSWEEIWAQENEIYEFLRGKTRSEVISLQTKAQSLGGRCEKIQLEKLREEDEKRRLSQ